ncbi:uncharacterized protein LOC144662533 [Oculina patagonica]
MKSVKRVFKRSFHPRYNLRSRKLANQTVKASTPKVDTSVQADLSEEDNCELLHELPFCPYTGLVPPPQATIESYIESHTEEPRRISTAFSSTGPVNRTNREAIDISVDQNEGPSIVQSNSPVQHIFRSPREASESSSLEDFTPIVSRQLQSGSRIALEVEKIREPSGKEANRPNQRQETSFAGQTKPIINSQASVHDQVRTRINYKKPKQNKRGTRSDSVSSDEFGYTETESEREDSGESENNKEISEENQVHKKDQDTESINTMEAAAFKDLQDQMATLQRQLRLQHQQTTSALEQAPLPETVSTRRPAPFHGYDSEDINRWLDKIENYLKLRRIDLASPTAQAELVMNLAGPAEDFYYSLSPDQKSTYAELRDSLRERFANNNQSWIIWQAVSTRQQGAIEPLDTYLTDLTHKFRRLNITDAEKMRFFVQGLRPEIRETVLLRQPKSFREAEEIARLTCAVKTTMNSHVHVVGVPNHLSYPTESRKPSDSKHDVLAKIEELSNKLQNAKEPTKTDATATDAKIIAKLDALIDGILPTPDEHNSRAFQAKPNASNHTANLAAYGDYRKRDSPDFIREIRRIDSKLDELCREMDARMDAILTADLYDNFRDENTSRIAAFSETNRNGAPELTEEIRRMERSFTNKLESLYRRVDNRINSLAHRNKVTRPERAGIREHNRQSKLVCYKCGRVGHIQYNCYYYHPDDQDQEVRHEHRAHYSQAENHQSSPHSSARLLALDAQYAHRVHEYHKKAESPRLEAQMSRQPVRTCSLNFEGENSSDHVIAALPKQENTNSQEEDMDNPSSNQEVKLTKANQRQGPIMPKQRQPYKRNRRETKSSVQQSNVFLSRGSDAKLTSNDLTTVGKIAGQAVQLLVDTGACVSAIDKQFFAKIYGQFPPKMSDCSLSSIQAVGGGTVKVLGKITVPLQLNGCEYPCEFHVMQNLTCDAILGRDFLQANKALIDLDNSIITFKGAGSPGKPTRATTVSVIRGTSFPQQNKLKVKKTVAAHDEKSIESDCKFIPRSGKNKGLGFQQPLLVLMLIILYLLTASCTPHTTDNAKPVIQNMPKFFVHRAPDDKVEDGQANREGTAQSLVPKEEKGERIKALQSRDTQSDYSSTVDQKLEKDAAKGVFDTMRTHLGIEVSRY